MIPVVAPDPEMGGNMAPIEAGQFDLDQTQ
jgi:hypothetical protein